MERMWRKVNQGLTISNKTDKNLNKSDNATIANSLAAKSSSTSTNYRSQNNSSTAIYSNIGLHTGRHISSTSSTEKRRRRRRKTSTTTSKCNKTHEISTNSNQLSSIVSKDATSLRERAVAKLKMLNFNINWNIHITNCRPCRSTTSNSNIITRRLCRNRQIDDNELYRSNSFKFERFKRQDVISYANTLPRPISVCDDYSLPVDFLKDRHLSISSDTGNHNNVNSLLNAQSPLAEEISQINVNLLNDQHDLSSERNHTLGHPTHHLQISENFANLSLDRTSKQFHKSDSSLALSSNDGDDDADDDDEDDLCDRQSPESLNERPPRKVDSTDFKPSPYYYSDIINKKNASLSNVANVGRTGAIGGDNTNAVRRKQRKSNTLDVQHHFQQQQNPKKKLSVTSGSNHQPTKRYSITEEGVHIIKCETPSTTTSDDSNCTECQKRREQEISNERLKYRLPNPTETSAIFSMPPHRLLEPAICACAEPADLGAADHFISDAFRPRSIFYVHDTDIEGCADCLTTANSSEFLSDGEMPKDVRVRQIYETAFDSKICRSDDDLDDLDLNQINSHDVGVSLQATSNQYINKQNEIERNLQQNNSSNPSMLTADFNNLKISTNNKPNINLELTSSSSYLPITTTGVSNRYTPSPPSTAPLPIKFPDKHAEHHTNSLHFLNGNKSAPNLPVTNATALHHHNSRLREQKECGVGVKVAAHKRDIIKSKMDDSTAAIGTNNHQKINFRPRHKDRRPGSMLILESERVLALRHKRRPPPASIQQLRPKNYSSTESMATSSSGESMESLRSSTSEGNRSTTSSESHRSTSLSSHSSDSGSRSLYPLRAAAFLHSKLHILSPISDKSLQEPLQADVSLGAAAVPLDNQSLLKNLMPPGGGGAVESRILPGEIGNSINVTKSLFVQNKTLSLLAGNEIQGSDSGISLQSRDGCSGGTAKSLNLFKNFPKSPTTNIQNLKCSNSGTTINQPPNSSSAGFSLGSDDIEQLPFDMPKLRRRKFLLEQKQCTSGSATSVDLGDLPFDMPKLKRRIRLNNQPSHLSGLKLQNSTESSGISQASSSQSVRDENHSIGFSKQNLLLQICPLNDDLNDALLDGCGAGAGGVVPKMIKGLHLNLGGPTSVVDNIDFHLPLDRQSWYHGSITRIEAENILRSLKEGSFLVRNCESSKLDYSLSLKSAKGFMHMRIQLNKSGQYILGQFSQPFDSITEIIRHFCLNRLPVRGAEHMCLLEPVAAQLL